MKKLLIFILSIVLVGCVDMNVIEVKHTDQGYTSQIIGTITKDDPEDFVYISTIDMDSFEITKHKADDTYQRYEVDVENQTVHEIEYKANNNNGINAIFWTDEYTISKANSQEIVNNQVIYTYTYYYEEDDNRTFLYEIKSPHVDSFSNVRIKYDYESKKGFFFIEENETLAIYEIKDKKLYKVKSMDLNYKGFTYSYSPYLNNEYAHLYENDKQLLLITNNQEIYYDKEIEDGYQLDYYNFDNEIRLEYENETSLLIIENDNRQVINKIKGDYELEEHYENNGFILLFDKDGYKKLLIDNKEYDLGYQPTYRIYEDYILSTSKEYKENKAHTIYIDRNENKGYLLSEPIELYDSYESFNCYLLKSYKNLDAPHSILKMKNHEFTMVDLPFTNDFEAVHAISENQMIYSLDTSEEFTLYLITLEE